MRWDATEVWNDLARTLAMLQARPGDILPWSWMVVQSLLWPLLAATLMLAVAWALLRGWPRVLTVLLIPGLTALAFYGWGLLVPTTVVTAPQAGMLRVASLNVLVVGKDEDAKLDFVRDSGAEVVALEEMYGRLRARLKEVEDVYPHQSTLAAGNNRRWGAPLYMTLLSRHPLRLVQQWGPELALYEVRAPSPYYLLQVHMPSPASGELLRQREAALKVLGEAALPKPLVVAGDFNTVPWDGALRRFLRSQKLRMVGTRLPTFPAALPLVPIDLVLTSEGGGGRVARVRVPGTDHLGIVADVAPGGISQP